MWHDTGMTDTTSTEAEPQLYLGLATTAQLIEEIRDRLGVDRVIATAPADDVRLTVALDTLDQFAMQLTPDEAAYRTVDS